MAPEARVARLGRTRPPACHAVLRDVACGRQRRNRPGLPTRLASPPAAAAPRLQLRPGSAVHREQWRTRADSQALGLHSHSSAFPPCVFFPPRVYLRGYRSEITAMVTFCCRWPLSCGGHVEPLALHPLLPRPFPAPWL